MRVMQSSFLGLNVHWNGRGKLTRMFSILSPEPRAKVTHTMLPSVCSTSGIIRFPISSYAGEISKRERMLVMAKNPRRSARRRPGQTLCIAIN